LFGKRGGNDEIAKGRGGLSKNDIVRISNLV
jgi:hypothetical protein